MNKDKIIKICERNKEEFKEIIKDIFYEDKGIFNSEMLMFVSLAKELKIKEIWESGRARGQSTKIIAEYFKNSDINIHSIESLSGTVDDKIALIRLGEYRKIDLLYNDSVKILPEVVKNVLNTIILIDGPKGMIAINLAEKLLKNKNVKAVFLHDYHKDSPLREVVEKTFENTFFTDDKEYVEKFKDLDNNCWIEHAKIGRYPYRRGNKEMQSYSSTLCVIFNKL